MKLINKVEIISAIGAATQKFIISISHSPGSVETQNEELDKKKMIIDGVRDFLNEYEEHFFDISDIIKFLMLDETKFIIH